MFLPVEVLGGFSKFTVDLISHLVEGFAMEFNGALAVSQAHFLVQ
jgi:hypothetical protein